MVKSSLVLSVVLVFAACVTSNPPDCSLPTTDKITYQDLFGEDPQPEKSPAKKNPYLDPKLIEMGENSFGEDNNPKLDAVAKAIIETIRPPYFADRIGFIPVGKGSTFDLTEEEARTLSIVGGKGPVGWVLVLSQALTLIPGRHSFDLVIKFRGVSRDSEEEENRVFVYTTYYSSFWDRRELLEPFDD